MAKRIEVSNLTAWFGSTCAVEDVNLTVESKQVTAVIGPSGCGKSTFLRTLNRMHEVIPGAHLKGSVLLDGANIYDSAVTATEVRRHIGMVFQRPNPFPHMSIAENVSAGLRLNGSHKRKNLDDIVENSLKSAGLWKEVNTRLNQSAGTLSGGQQQRLCIARSIAVQPDVLLMDEPCSALDPASTLRIEDLIAELKNDYTVVIVTHNMQQAARVSDVTAFFTIEEAGQPGKLVEMGETPKIFTQPENRRTEEYITGRFG